jgi:hypothetical protein
VRGTWRARLLETFAVVAIGDGVIEVVSPKEHSLLWEIGPEGARKTARFFAENPNLMRLPGGLRALARARQYRGR